MMERIKDTIQILILITALAFVISVLIEIGRFMPPVMGWCFITALGLCAVYAGILVYERSK